MTSLSDENAAAASEEASSSSSSSPPPPSLLPTRSTAAAVAVAAASNGKQQEDATGSRRQWLQSYQPLPYKLLEEEVLVFRAVQESMNQQWEEECQKYEETMVMRVDGTTRTVPRRNYLNATSVVTDEMLFPYHASCYPLLDAYDCIYEDDDDDEVTDHPPQPQPVSVHAVRHVPFVRPQDRHPDGISELPGFMPSSPEAVLVSLVQEVNEPFGGDGDYFWPCLTDHIQQHKRVCGLQRLNTEDTATTDLFDALHYSKDAEGWVAFAADRLSLTTSGPYGPLHLPRERNERANLLLKLMRHSLSELQRDYRLAAAAMVLLMRFRDLDDVQVLRRFLAVMEAEFVWCGCPCEPHVLGEAWENNHSCADWRELSIVLQNVVSDGVTCWTQEHAVCLAGFVRATYFREFGSLHHDPAEDSVVGKRKCLLKRTVVGLQAPDDEDDGDDRPEKIPAQLIEIFVTCLGERGMVERNRLLKWHSDYYCTTNNNNSMDCCIPEDIIGQCVESYHNCVRALVSVAESTVQLLIESERFYNIASGLVSSLCRTISLHEMDGDQGFRTSYNYAAVDYARTLQAIRLIAPLRYANCVTDSTARILDRLAKRNALVPSLGELHPSAVLLQNFDWFFEQGPPKEVVTAVQGLFLGNLVDVRHSGLGYGDFLLFCRGEISPLDPLLFW
jgi:hypothetical protein